MGLIERHARNLIRRKVRQPAGRAIRRAVERWCPECRKNVPLFHTCVIRTDFTRRTASAKAGSRRQARNGARKPQERQSHDYRSCTDPRCRRPACVAFREGQAECTRAHV
jgi:hypothetical protein